VTRKTDSNETKIMIKRLEDIRNLLVLIANKSGATQDEISTLLGINERKVRKWLNHVRTLNLKSIDLADLCL